MGKYILLAETISHLRKDYPKISEKQFNKILKLDPTYAGGDKETPYTRWIFKLIYNNIKNAENLQRYNELMKKYPSGINTETNQPINKPIMLPEVLPEDVYKIPDLIAGYEENKKLIKLPITSFTSLPAPSKAISDAIQKDISIDEKAGKNFRVFKEAIPDGLNVVYQDDSWIIGIPSTYKASEHFKEITSWCTGKPNMYAKYTEKLGGNPLYIHLNKKTGDLYQMDFGTSSFMDSFDNSIDVPLFLKENPQLKKFYESIILQNNKFLSMPENWKFIDKKYITEEKQLEVVKQDGSAIYYIIKGGITPSEKVQLAAVKQKSGAIQFIDNPTAKVKAYVKQYRLHESLNELNPFPKASFFKKTVKKRTADELLKESVQYVLDKKDNTMTNRLLTEAILTEGIMELRLNQFPLIPETQFNDLIKWINTTLPEALVRKYTRWIFSLIYPTFKNKKLKQNWEELMQQYPDGINTKTNQQFVEPTYLPEIPEEDWNKIPQLVKQYDIYKDEIKQPITTFKDINILYTKIQEVKNKGIPEDDLAYKRYKLFKKAEKEGLKIIYESNNWIVGIPTTKKASCMFGEDTNWCTTSASGNMYELYTRKGDLYINLNKVTGELYQFSFAENQFMNEYDDAIDVSVLFNSDLGDFYLKMLEKDPEIISNFIKWNNLTVLSETNDLITASAPSDILSNIMNLNSYQKKYDYLSFEKIDNILSGNIDEITMNWDFDTSMKYPDDSHFDKIMKDYNIKWDDIISIYNDEPVDLDITENQIKEIQTLLHDDFYEDSDVISVLDNCAESGTVDIMVDSTLSVINNIKGVESVEIGAEKPIIVSLPKKAIIISILQDKDILLSMNDDKEYVVSEPRYGWEGFDEIMWNEAQDYFIKNLKKILSNKTNSDESLQESINSILKSCNIPIIESVSPSNLYHSTSLSNALNILMDNVLKGYTYQNLNNSIIRGISTSRSKTFSKDFTMSKAIDYKNTPFIIFELDYDALKANHKIIPYNFFSGLKNYNKRLTKGGNEFEEFIIGDVNNIKKYIKKIYVNPIVFQMDENEMLSNYINDNIKDNPEWHKYTEEELIDNLKYNTSINSVINYIYSNGDIW